MNAIAIFSGEFPVGAKPPPLEISAYAPECCSIFLTNFRPHAEQFCQLFIGFWHANRKRLPTLGLGGSVAIEPYEK